MGMPQVPPARYLLRAKDLVDARYAEPITVDDLAAAAGLSRAHFSRMFTRTFGESPHQGRAVGHPGGIGRPGHPLALSALPARRAPAVRRHARRAGPTTP